MRTGFLAALALMYTLSVAGAKIAWRRGDSLGRLGMVLLAAYFAHGLILSGIAASSRYTEPVRTMLLLLTAGAIAAWWERRRAVAAPGVAAG